MALRTALDTSGEANAAPAATGEGRDAELSSESDGAYERAMVFCAAFWVAVCGVAILITAGDPPRAVLADLSTTDDSGSGKRLSFSVMARLSSARPAAASVSDQSAGALLTQTRQKQYENRSPLPRLSPCQQGRSRKSLFRAGPVP